jgi:hypothetical protein
MPLCDSVLRLAALALFEAYWSEMILTEVGRTLAKFGKSEAQIKNADSRKCVKRSPRRSLKDLNSSSRR